jgi:hypothetical protein
MAFVGMPKPQDAATAGLTLARRSYRCCSLGYVIAPKPSMRALQKIHQNFFISANAAVQKAGIDFGPNGEGYLRFSYANSLMKTTCFDRQQTARHPALPSSLQPDEGNSRFPAR